MKTTKTPEYFRNGFALKKHIKDNYWIDDYESGFIPLVGFEEYFQEEIWAKIEVHFKKQLPETKTLILGLFKYAAQQIILSEYDLMRNVLYSTSKTKTIMGNYFVLLDGKILPNYRTLCSEVRGLRGLYNMLLFGARHITDLYSYANTGLVNKYQKALAAIEKAEKFNHSLPPSKRVVYLSIMEKWEERKSKYPKSSLKESAYIVCGQGDDAEKDYKALKQFLRRNKITTYKELSSKIGSLKALTKK